MELQRLQVKGKFTADNSYAVYVGNENEVLSRIKQATNTQASQIFQAEDLEFEAAPGDFLYIIAWSDDSTLQGLLGSFSGDVTIETGDPRWQVLATGRNRGDDEFPAKTAINQFIERSTPGDWVEPFVGSRNTADGEPYRRVVRGIPESARWVWHDSGKDDRNRYPESPYVPFAGFNHDEFLIFRIATEELTANPTFRDSGVTQGGTIVNVNCTHSESESGGRKEKCYCCCPPPVICSSSCAFEVRLQRWKFVGGSAGWLDRNAELTFISHVDGNMHNYPSANGSFVVLGKRKGDFWKGWQAANARVGVVEVPCGSTRSIDIMTEMVEGASFAFLGDQTEGERAWGVSEPKVMTLECGSKPSPVRYKVKLESSGNRTEDLEIEFEYRASQVSVCGCSTSK